MPVDVHWKPAPATIGPPCANNVVGVIAKGERLSAGEKATNATCYNIVKWFAFFVEINHFIEVNNNAVEFAVVGNANGPNNKCNIGVGRNTECLRKWSIFAVGKVGKEFAYIMGNCCNLRLLTFHGDGFAFATHLYEKRAFTGATNGGGSKCIGCIEVAIGGHDGANSDNDPPVEFTVRTMGAPPP